MDDPLIGHMRSPAIFLDGDGTLNVDCPYCAPRIREPSTPTYSGRWRSSLRII